MSRFGGLKRKRLTVVLTVTTAIFLSAVPTASADHSFIMPAAENGCGVDIQLEAEHSVDRNPVGYGDITFTNLDTGATYLQRSRYSSTETFESATESWHITIRGNIWLQLYPGEPGPSGVVEEPGADLLFSGILEFTMNIDQTVITALSFKGTYDDLCALLND